MNNASGLAAVHLAAAAAVVGAPATHDANAQPPAAAKPTTVAELASAFPELAAALRTEGASSERARIIGIEAHALAGHEALIATCKSDAACTPDMAAGRIIAAEKVVRDAQMQGVRDVEKLTGNVKAAAASELTPPREPAADKATTPDGWKAEWAASKPLQNEFLTVEAYVAFMKAESEGRVKILGGKKAAS